MIDVMHNKHFQVRDMNESHFIEIKKLADEVFGWCYLSIPELEETYSRSCIKGFTSNFVIVVDERLVGFRLTYGPGTWEITEDYTPEKWGVVPEKVCYFKTSCVHPDYSGMGLGQVLIGGAIGRSRSQGAVAGIADIWLNSPHNSAYKYFSKAGGQVVNIYHDRWVDFHTQSNPCSRDGFPCHCLGAEMILHFEDKK